MRKILRMFAVLVALTAAGLWLFSGRNHGLTITSTEIVTPDAVTGLEKREWKGTFVPGVDFLGAAAMAAGILAGASFLFRKKIET